MNTYDGNLEALAKVDTELYLKLKDIKTNEMFEVFLAENDKISNANIIDHRDNSSIHESKSNHSEKIKEFEELDHYNTLYIFGIGNGALYDKLLQNPRHRHLMLIEPEIELIYIALNLFDFSKDILSNRLKIILSETITQESITKLIVYESVLFLKTYNLHLYSDFYEKYSEEISRVSNIIVEFFKNILNEKGNNVVDTLTGFANSISRISEMLESPSIVQLLQKVKNRKSAVLVSTGPSLYKQLPLLKKVQNYITIICADASFPILSKEGIKPDIVLSMEREAPTAKFYKDTPSEFHKDVIFLLSTVCHDETLKSIDPSGVVSLFMRGDNHNRIFGLDEWGYLGGGMSCANYLYDLASRADFNYFTFIGQDLSYGKDGSSHCKNHVYGADEVVTENATGYVDAYGGLGKVMTMKWWHLFLDSFAFQIDYANKNLNMKTYNSTEGGARISGTIEIPFQEFCDKFVDLSTPKDKIYLEIPSQETVEKKAKKYMTKQKEILQFAKSVSKNAKKSFGEIELFLGKIKDYDNEEITKNVSIKELDKINKRLAEVKDKYNRKSFLDIFDSLLTSYLGQLEFDVANVSVMRENTIDAIKLKKTNWLKLHYEWLYRLYSTLDEVIKIIERSSVEKK